MTPLILLALAPAEAAPASPPVDVRTIDFDLKSYRAAPDCGPAGSDTILVCGRRGGAAYPLDKMARIFEAGPTDAETSLSGNVRGGLYLRQVEFPNGEVSRRILIGLKMPF